MLVGVPLRDADGQKIPPGPEQRFAVSAVPDDWPLDWGPGQFAFPEVYPRMPVRKDYPPDQVNLDRVLDFVLGLTRLTARAGRCPARAAPRSA